VLFNFYGDVGRLGGELAGAFEPALKRIDQAIARYPERVLLTGYLAGVVAGGRLYDEAWGHAVCTSVSVDHPANVERLGNGKPFNPHFRAYNADFETTRRCCTGVQRDCASCFDVWEHYSWVMLNLRKHLDSVQQFTNWLTSTYLFYYVNRLVDVAAGRRRLPELQRRSGRAVQGRGRPGWA